MTTPNFLRHKKPAEAAKALAEILKDSITQAYHSGSKLNIALSGGSTPLLLYKALAKEPYRSGIPWDCVRFFWGDERCVPPTDAQSNFGAAFTALFNKVEIPEYNLHRIRGEADPTSEALRYAGEILKYVSLNTKGLPVFDHIILGIGTDGHTASLFPGSVLESVFKDICGVATHPETGQKRISLTLNTINAAARVSFLVSGKEKSPIMAKIAAGGGEVEFPAAAVKLKSGNLSWIIDNTIKI